MHPLESYIQELRAIRSSGAAVPETAYYPALANLLNEIGRKLKPKVKCIMALRDTGAGLPDGGLFTEDQIRNAQADVGAGPVPARGAIEAKPTDADVQKVADSKQVQGYWTKYRQVLVTNYRDFLLVGADADGNRMVLETYHLARDEREFWRKAGHARAFADQHGASFEEFLKRVMLYQASLAAPRDLAWFLASYAREARFRIENGELPALAGIRTALEEALGLKFEGAHGDHFFRSTLIQTLFYGVFSAWVLWSRTHRSPARQGRFEWQRAAEYLRVPVLRKLFHEVAEPGQLETMNLPEVLDWAGAALNRVEPAFFAAFEDVHAVQYFYEPFLEAFDPELRKDLGVWYTPIEIVKYMVERIDTELRNTLGVADGLADPNVYILDPCCGTGAYLVEVLRKIEQTLRAKGGDALVGHDLKRAALERVFGFEILPAPFVVSHLQLGLLLQSLGAPLADNKKERAGVYLTNALTGWEPVKHPKQLVFREMEEEREAADRVKQDAPILVILGNPPYNSFAGIAQMDEERGLSEAYRATQAAPAPQGQGLNDLYVRFFRMAERRIVEKTGRGIVSFISNYSWLDGLSFTGMRERYLEVFDRICIDCLNGDKYKTGKLTSEGDPDPSVFSTEFNKEGIQVGTAIALLIRTPSAQPSGEVRFRHLWGKDKRARLVETAVQDGAANYERLVPPLALGLPFAPATVEAAYISWPLLPGLFGAFSPAVKTSRDLDLVEIDLVVLQERMEAYFDASVDDEALREVAPGLLHRSARYEPRATRKALLKRGIQSGHFLKYTYRPFDDRHVYWHPETKLLDEKREDLFALTQVDNLFLTSRQKGERQIEGSPFFVTRHLADWHLTRPGAICFPRVVPERSLFRDGGHDAHLVPNLSSEAAAYIETLDMEANATDALWFHVLAIGHSPRYLQENADGLRQDWPRIPLPSSKKALQASADLGRQLASLLDADCGVKGVIASPLRPEIRVVGQISGASTHLDADAGDLDVTAGWGHAGKGGITMPAQGRVAERPYDPQERVAIAQGAGSLGLTPEQAMALLGETTLDVYLNDRAFWKNIPVRVWDYTLGGYQVIKKWLSYREKELLGRSITPDEARYVTSMTRRIAAILLLGPALDANYEATKQATYIWCAK
jgi:hypothetical protein